MKKGQYQYYLISLYNCNEKHDGNYKKASLFNCRPLNIVVVKRRRTEDDLTKPNDL